MPTYEFRCPNGHEFERFYRKISDAESEVACPECGVVAVRQLSAGAGLLFKGSGFYLTDYGKNAHRKSGPAAGKSTDGKPEGKPEGKSEGKSEGKPEGKSEGKSEEGGRRDAKSDAKPAADKPTTPKASGSSGGDKS